MSIYFHLLFSWTKSKENLCLFMDVSWKHLRADASNNLLPSALNVLEWEAQVGRDWGLGEREIVFVLASCTFYCHLKLP